MNILAIGAHPDDIEIYMFGTLAACAARGDRLDYVIATDGAKGGNGDPVALSALRKNEARSAAALLDAKVHFLDFADGELVPDQSLILTLKSIIAEMDPDLILTHPAIDYHGDHRALSEAVRIAASFSAPVLYCDALRGVGPMPSYYVDITAHRAKKAIAINAHASQDPERFVVASEQLSAFRASQANGAAESHAEAFHFEPIFPFVDIRALLPPAPPVHPVANRARMRRLQEPSQQS
ncbi:PIG-L deacetylase family protein [Devosia chinhatensis]|uniref:LmbE family protein n=1 Tax=Devosia chinhatensis TaxID=429727 RepID=A0A0F5FJ29_9HYPH|nr:PIG-L deacetylase family protein [Devosia chinhatensis]KKB08909.1 LmbE family protein [Devosia chinhatensis]